MLFAVAPPAGIALLVGPCVDAEAVLLILLIEALIHPAILPRVYAIFIHYIAPPVPYIPPPIAPLIEPVAGNDVVLPLPLIAGPVCPAVLAHPVLPAVFVLADELGAIWPGFLALPVLEVGDPVAEVFGTVRVRILSESVRLIVLPLPLIHLALRVCKHAVPACAPDGPGALVPRPILPHHHPLSVPEAALPLALVDGTAALVDVLFF